MGKKTRDRAEQILDFLLRSGKCSVDELAIYLGVSAASVRRDLTALESRGAVQRTHGAVELAGKTTYEAFRFDAAFPLREERFAEAKRRIALTAAERVYEGETLALTPGTTVTQLARVLRHRTNIHIVTSAVNIGMELSSIPAIQLTLTGGAVRWPGAFSMVGGCTLETLEKFYFDAAFVGVCGVHPEHGITVIQPDEASVLRAVLMRSKRRIIVADSSKVGATSAASVCKASEITTLITDSGVRPQIVKALQKQKVEVIVV